MKVLFVYPRFRRHAESNPELLDFVPMNEYLGSPSLGIAAIAAVTPAHWQVEYRDDRIEPADRETDADLVAFSFFTPAASRAIELAGYFRASGKKVVAGGIFPSALPDELTASFDAVVVGEGEDSWRRLLADCEAGALRPRYRAEHPVSLEALPPPRVSLYIDKENDRFQPDDYPVQTSRGCALGCHACALPTSMGTRQRHLPLDHIVAQLAALGRAGKRACLTEDTGWFPGNAAHRLRDLFDRMVELRGDDSVGPIAPISYIGISLPMILHSPMSLLLKARAAGVGMFYLVGGFDPISMRAFTGKDPRALARARDAIAKTLDAGIDPYTSFLIGLDDDDEGTADRILDFAATSGIRKAEFAVFTPYPGTPSWHRLLAEGRILSRDWSRYNDANVVFRPAQMTPERLHADYLKLWREFYSSKGHFAQLPQLDRTIQF